MHLLSRISNWCIDFLFPKSSETLSLESLSTTELYKILPPATETGNKDFLAIFDYSHKLVKELIWELKYNGNKSIADKLGLILFDTIQDELTERSLRERWSEVTLLPTPISDKRRLQRGWNQAELLLEAIRRHDVGHNFKYLPRQLIKPRHTESQTHTGSRSERLKNLADSMMVVHKPAAAGKCVVVIDDVTTTGATFAEARRALRAAGAKKILCIAVAH